MKLLLVEDEVQLSEALSQILIKNNYSVDAVDDGAVLLTEDQVAVLSHELSDELLFADITQFV